MLLRDQSGKLPADPSVRRVHEFPADIVRAGGRPTKVTYNVQCSRCQRASAYETVSIKSDERVAEKFKQRGWLLGKTRGSDVCPTCQGLSPNTQLAKDQSVNNPAEMVLSPAQLAELVFMPKRMGEGSPVDVEVRGARRMSRARQQAEATANSIFAKGPGAKPTLTLGGVKAEAEALFKPPAAKPLAAPSQASHRPFAPDQTEVVGALRNDMSVLAAALTSMAEQIALMAQVQAAAIVENRDKANEQTLLQKQNLDVISRLAPIVAGVQGVIVASGPEASPDSSASVSGPSLAKSTTEVSGAPSAAEGGGTDLQAKPEAENAIEPQAPAKATGRILPSQISTISSGVGASAHSNTDVSSRKNTRGKSAKSAAKAKAKTAPQVAPNAASSAAAASISRPEGAATQDGKRFRRTKAQMEEFRREQEKLAALGLKRGRGRPSKSALSAEQLAAIAASDDPEAALAEAMSAARSKPAGETPKAVPNDATPTESESVTAAPGADVVEPGMAKTGSKPNVISEVENAPATVSSADMPEVAGGKRRGPKPKASAEFEAASNAVATPVAAEGKRRGRKPKMAALGIESSPAVAADAAPATEPKRRGRKPKSLTAPELVAAPEAAPIGTPTRRGPKPKVVAAIAPDAAAASVKRGPGRPRKDAAPAPDVAPVAKRGPGRPRKDVGAQVSSAPAKSAADGEGAPAVNWAKVKVTSDVMVLNSGKTTTMQIGRKIWEAAGFADDESVFVSSDGPEIKITRQPGGRKPSSSKGSVITLTVPSIGAASLWKIKYAVAEGALLLRGQIAN